MNNRKNGSTVLAVAGSGVGSRPAVGSNRKAPIAGKSNNKRSRSPSTKNRKFKSRGRPARVANTHQPEAGNAKAPEIGDTASTPAVAVALAAASKKAPPNGKSRTGRKASKRGKAARCGIAKKRALRRR
ncbi:hypothetical protein BV898_05197 [Hypsibius exemplaris]|uniref:Uncharacterized protein n=1 Tax=Hypsibius exemplaris TaxID=2072580 RepID=A0A1W0X096_HYPEX|nr:hypothetical protein BV898_05197 [Hypsibius exemplaris]